MLFPWWGGDTFHIPACKYLHYSSCTRTVEDQVPPSAGALVLQMYCCCLWHLLQGLTPRAVKGRKNLLLPASLWRKRSLSQTCFLKSQVCEAKLEMEGIVLERFKMLTKGGREEEWNQVCDTMQAPVITTEKPPHYWKKHKISLLFISEENRRSYGLQESFPFQKMQCSVILKWMYLLSFECEKQCHLLLTSHRAQCVITNSSVFINPYCSQQSCPKLLLGDHQGLIKWLLDNAIK